MKKKNKTINSIGNSVKNFIHNEWASSIMAIITIALSILPLLKDYKSIKCIIFFSILLLIYSVLYYFNYCIKDKKTKKIKDLERELDSTKKELEIVKKAYNDVFEFELIKIYQKLDFGNHERISIYKVEEKNCKVVSRHSVNPEFRKYDKDKTYPLNRGFIGEAWKNKDNYFFHKALPDYEKKTDKYIAKCKELCDIDADTIKQLSMKSRSYYCKVLRNSDETDNIAIIVFESLSTKNINKEHIDSILKEENKSLATFIQKIVFEVIKSNTDLSKEGF